MSKEKLERAGRQLQDAVNMHLITTAVLGCMVRDLWIAGDEDAANAAIKGGEPMAKLVMELTHDLETRIRNGASLYRAADAMRMDGWMARIEPMTEGI